MNHSVNKALLILTFIILVMSVFAQSRTSISFNDGWQYYRANNTTFFTDFPNGAKCFESQNQWTTLEIWEDVTRSIYRPAHLITTSKTSFIVTDRASAGIYIRQKNVSSKSTDIIVEAKLETKEKTIQQAELITEIRDYESKVVLTQKDPVKISPQGVTYVSQQLNMKNPRLWYGVRDPYLY